MIRRPPRSTQSRSSAASDVYKRQVCTRAKCFHYFFTVLELSQLFSCKTLNDVFHPPCLCSPGYSCESEQPSLTFALVRSERSSYVAHTIADAARQRNCFSVLVLHLVDYPSTVGCTGASSDVTANAASSFFVTSCSLPPTPLTPASSFTAFNICSLSFALPRRLNEFKPLCRLR